MKRKSLLLHKFHNQDQKGYNLSMDLRVTKRKIQTTLSAAMVFFAWAGVCQAASIYMPDNCPDLRTCVSQMQGGDTLIIRDGTYSGSNNVLTQNQMPPSGTCSNADCATGSYTIIRAENDGMAYFPDGFCNTSNNVERQYLQFEGLRSKGVFNINGHGDGTTPNYYRILRCSFEGIVDGTVVGVIGATYVLFEDCWAFGKGSYKFLAYAPNYGQTHHIVYRRCLAQIDDVYGSLANHIAGFTAYRSDDVSYQNSIALGGERDEFWYNMLADSDTERGRGWYPVHGASNTTWDGCMAMDIKGAAISGSPSVAMDIQNFVALNVAQLIWTRENGEGGLPIFAPYTINHCTFRTARSTTGLNTIKPITGQGISQYNATPGSINIYNSILTDVQPDPVFNAGNVPVSDYNLLYENSINYSGISAGVNDYQSLSAVDPLDGNPGNGIACLKYPTRVENGSDCNGTGSTGSDRGATITNRIGISGTHYGQTGWDDVTGESLWPWPNEERLKSEVANYSSGEENIIPNGTDTLSGARGFAFDGTGLYGGPITLTSYIWEYFGNPCPEEICSYEEDIIAPSIPSGLNVL